MVNPTRLTVATLLGLLFGFVCYRLASSGGALPEPVGFQIIAERTLIGFAIGISVLRLWHWAIHGLVMGLVVSIPLAISGLMAPESPEFTRSSMFVMTIVLGMIYGFLIELITTKVFKAGREVRVATPAT